MTTKKIERPKVFISYAWGSDEYMEKVVAFSERLIGDGVDVILDKWDLKLGNDAIDFMERCVKDPSVTSVLMLINDSYTQKADGRQGGVGTETQIISSKVYGEVQQTKFIPIVFEKGENGEICMPIYLKSKYHADLSKSGNEYEAEYRHLVRVLFGEDFNKKPELGQKPAWVSSTETIDFSISKKYESIKRGGKIAERDYSDYLLALKDELIEIARSNIDSVIKEEIILELYASLKDLRTKFLTLVKNSPNLTNRNEETAKFFEDIYNELPEGETIGIYIVRNYLHEMFIYNIAYNLRYGDFEAVGYFLGKTYANVRYNFMNQYTMFYSYQNVRIEEKAGLTIDTAQMWINDIDVSFCNKQDFILGDLICYNYSIYGNIDVYSPTWVPFTYSKVQKLSNNLLLKQYGQKLISQEWLKKIIKIFNYDKAEDFIEKFKIIEGDFKRSKSYKEKWSVDYAYELRDYIEAKDIGAIK